MNEWMNEWMNECWMTFLPITRIQNYHPIYLFSAVCTAQVKQVHQHGISRLSVPASKYWGAKGSRNFSGGGGERPSIGIFYQLVQDHAHFFLIAAAFKVKGRGQTRGKTKFALPWRHNWCGFMFIACLVHGVIIIAKVAMVRVLTNLSDMTVRQAWCFTNFKFSIGEKYYLKN